MHCDKVFESSSQYLIFCFHFEQLIGVINKCLTILLNLVVWDQHAAPGGVIALLVCLAGGTLYRQAPMRNAKNKELEVTPSKDVEEAETESLVTAENGGSADQSEQHKNKAPRKAAGK